MRDILTAEVALKVPAIPSMGTCTTSTRLTGAAKKSAVVVSPVPGLPDGLVIASARVSQKEFVEVRFVNVSAKPLGSLAFTCVVALIGPASSRKTRKSSTSRPR